MFGILALILRKFSISSFAKRCRMIVHCKITSDIQNKEVSSETFSAFVYSFILLTIQYVPFLKTVYCTTHNIFYLYIDIAHNMFHYMFLVITQSMEESNILYTLVFIYMHTVIFSIWNSVSDNFHFPSHTLSEIQTIFIQKLIFQFFRIKVIKF